jgi:hypothetical protein
MASEILICQCGCGEPIPWQPKRPWVHARFIRGHEHARSLPLNDPAVVAAAQTSQLPLLVVARFLAVFNAMEKPADPNACWLWPGNREGRGYGRLKVKRRIYKAYRVSLLLHKGPLSAGEIPRHTCDNMPCVRPDHLIPGTQRDNVMDKIDRRRGGYGEKHGMSKLTVEDVAEIRRLLTIDTKYGRYSRIARQFGVRHITILRIDKGQGWTRD